MALYVKDSHDKKRREVVKKYKGVTEHLEELYAHRKQVNTGIEVLEKEMLMIEGEFRVLEELLNEERRLQANITKK